MADAAGVYVWLEARNRGQVWLLAVILVSSAACAGVSRGAPEAATKHAVLMSQPVVFVPANIDFTGKTDVTNALQSFIDNVDNGVIVRFHKSGKYRVDGTLFVTNKMSITFDGQNATIFATTPGTLERSQWWITGGAGLIFRHFIVQGANPHAGLADNAYDPAREKQHGFRIEGVDGIELDHVTVTDVYGDFVYVARFVADPSTNVWIHDSTFSRNGRQGISLVAAVGVIIERNSFSDTRRGTIDLEPNGPNQSVSDAFILNNTIGAGRLLFLASHGKGPVNDIVISGNHLHKHPMTHRRRAAEETSAARTGSSRTTPATRSRTSGRSASSTRTASGSRATSSRLPASSLPSS